MGQLEGYLACAATAADGCQIAGTTAGAAPIRRVGEDFRQEKAPNATGRRFVRAKSKLGHRVVVHHGDCGRGRERTVKEIFGLRRDWGLILTVGCTRDTGVRVGGMKAAMGLGGAVQGSFIAAYVRTGSTLRLGNQVGIWETN